MSKSRVIYKKNVIQIYFLVCLILLVQIFAIPITDTKAKEELIVERQENNTLSIDFDKDKWLLPENFLQHDSTKKKKEFFPSFEQVYGAQYIVADLKTDEIILEKNIDDIAYPASMTKVLTALTILEAKDFDLEKPVIFSEHAVSLPSALSVSGGFVVGEETSTENALYTMMVSSANDCARALAETYGGTEENFVSMMNEKAREIGCQNTNMVDVAGFGLEDHHFTARDLFKIIKRAMSNDFFREMVSAKYYLAQPTSQHNYSGWNSYRNSNQLLIQGDTSLSSDYLHTYDGVKTGTTSLAGYCLSATVYTYDGRHLCGIIFDGQLRDTEDDFVEVSVLLRSLLEEAALLMDCPTEDQAYQFLADHPEFICELNRNSYANSLSTLHQGAYISEEKAKELMFLEKSEISLEYFNNEKDESLETKKKTEESISSTSNSINSSQLKNDEKTLSEKTLKLEKYYLILAGVLIIIILLIIMIVITIKKSKKSKTETDKI